jgi:ABC-type Fe3+ transport system permease subunit/DNA-binding beta-propeller fold protein YncE
VNWLLLKNSLLVSSLATALAVVFGLVAALWAAGLPARWRTRFLVLAIVALALPPFLVTNAWLHFLGNAGTWRRWLPFNVLSQGGTVWILSLLLWPIPLLAVSSAWRRLEPAQLESDMAVTGWALVRALLLPLGLPALVPAAVLTFVLALNNFAVPAILQVNVLPALVWIRFSTAFDTLGALRLGWPLVVGPLLLLVWFSRREIPWPHLEASVPDKLFRQQLGSGWFCGCGVCSLLLGVLSVGLPLAQILSVRRTWTELPGALAAGQSAVWNSFWLPAVSATTIVLLGLGFAIFGGAAWLTSSLRDASDTPQRPDSRRKRLGGHFLPSPISFFSNLFRISGSLFSSLLWLPFLVPGVLLGIILIACFNHTWSAFFYQSAGIVVVAFVIRYLAVGWNTAARASQGIDRDLLDVARLEGAAPWQTFRHVYWPQIAPQVVAVWYIIFLLCLWDVESMLLVVPPGRETLALRIFNLLHYGYNAQVNALCLTLLVVALTPLLLWQVCHLSHFTFHVSRFTHHASRITHQLPLLALLLVCSSLLPSCSPPSSATDAPLQSRLFSRVQIIGSRGVGVGQLNKPRSVTIDRQDNLYVVDMTGRVQKFSPSGVFELLWQMPQTDLGKPKGMGRDRDGNIIAVEPHYQRVNHFSTAGKLVAQWGEKGTNFGQLWMPRAVAVNSRGDIFVSEYGAVERVQKFAFPGGGGGVPQCVLSFGKPGNGPGEFNRPEGLCVDSQDRLYVADSCNHRIQVFCGDGEFLRAYGKAGSGKGELSYPYDICVDAVGRQYVCEFGNSRIQVFDADDQPLEVIGGPGADPGWFSNPWSEALDSAGNLYVADSQNHRVQKLVSKESGAPRVAGRRRTTGFKRPVLAADLGLETWDFRFETTITTCRLSTFSLPRLDFGLWTLDFGLPAK